MKKGIVIVAKKKTLAQKTYEDTVKARRWFAGTRNEFNTERAKKKNTEAFLKQSKEDIKTASEKGRFSCILYYKVFKFKEPVEGYNKQEILSTLKELDKEGFKTTYEDTQDGVLVSARWDNE